MSIPDVVSVALIPFSLGIFFILFLRFLILGHFHFKKPKKD